MGSPFRVHEPIWYLAEKLGTIPDYGQSEAGVMVRCRHCGERFPTREKVLSHLFKKHPDVVEPLLEPHLEVCPPFAKKDEGPSLFDGLASGRFPRLDPLGWEYNRDDDHGDMAFGFHEITIADLYYENWETQ